MVRLYRAIRRHPPVRWAVAATVITLLVVLVEVALAELATSPRLGVRAESDGQQIRISWVQPAGLAWDAGVRPGDRLLTLDGYPAADGNTSETDTAQSVEVENPSGTVIRAAVSRESSQRTSQQRFLFLPIAAGFVLLGTAVFVLAADQRSAVAFLAFASTGAVMLIAAVATPFGAGWALALTYVGLLCFSCSTFLLFLAFPVDRLARRSGRVAAGLSIAVKVALIVWYPWAVTVDPTSYETIKRIGFAAMALDFVGTAFLVGTAYRDRMARRETRRALSLMLIGVVVGLMPFSVLGLGAYLVGFGYLVPPHLGILTIAVLPIVIAAAVLSRQFIRIDRLVRRGLVALSVWVALVAVYGSVFALVRRGAAAGDLLAGVLNSPAVEIALVAATFPVIVARLRAAIEQRLFRDVYDYKGTLQQMGDEIVRLDGVGTIANHVLSRLGATLDLQWASIDLTGDRVAQFRWQRAMRDGGTLLPGTTMVPDGAPQMLEVPLMADGIPIGTFNVGPKRGDLELLPDDVALVSTVATVVATALSTALLVERLEAQLITLEDREQALTALSAQLMRVQEEERRRLALDLHDESLQRALLLARELRDEPPSLNRGRHLQMVEDLTISLRAVCAGLRPAGLDDFGLVSGLERLVNDVRARGEVEVTLTVQTHDGTLLGRFDSDQELALYRVVQEALNNTLKHAGATRVAVSVEAEETRLRVTVVDDGVGLSNRAQPGDTVSRVGITGMGERLRPFGGTVVVQPAPGRGTIVIAETQVRGVGENRKAADPRGDRRRSPAVA
jgi:signal transduction histidine kinase